MTHKPTFIYICTGCGHKQEINVSANVIASKCPECGSKNPKFREDQEEAK